MERMKVGILAGGVGTRLVEEAESKPMVEIGGRPIWPAPGYVDTRLSESGLPFEFHRAQISDRRVSAFRIVEAFDVVEHIRFGLIPRSVVFTCCAFGLERREEASIAALSQTLPDRLIEQTTPLSAINGNEIRRLVAQLGVKAEILFAG